MGLEGERYTSGGFHPAAQTFPDLQDLTPELAMQPSWA